VAVNREDIVDKLLDLNYEDHDVMPYIGNVSHINLFDVGH
jgi:hypothetical protein